jgi:hypothetical protein
VALAHTRALQAFSVRIVTQASFHWSRLQSVISATTVMVSIPTVVVVLPVRWGKCRASESAKRVLLAPLHLRHVASARHAKASALHMPMLVQEFASVVLLEALQTSYVMHVLSAAQGVRQTTARRVQLVPLAPLLMQLGQTVYFVVVAATRLRDLCYAHLALSASLLPKVPR